MVIQLLKLHVGVGEIIGVPVRIIIQHATGGLYRGGVDNELGVILPGQVRGVGSLETGRGSSDKGGDGQDALIFRQQLIEAIAHGGGTVQRGSLREIDLDGELIPVGYRHHTLAQLGDHQDRQGNRQDAQTDRGFRETESPRQCPRIDGLYGIQQIEPLLARILPPGLQSLLDQDPLQQRDKDHRHRQRHHEGDGKCPREEGHEIQHLPRHREKQREKDHADTQRSQQDRAEIVLGAIDGGVPTGIALVQIFQIGVYHDDGVIHDHAQYHDQGGQRHRIQRDAASVHDTDRDKDTDRDGGSRHQCRAEREQYHHHQDHDHDGHEQIPHEGTYRVSHHLRLVGDPADRDTLGKIPLESVQYLVYLLSVSYDIMALTHLHGKDDRFLAVVRYIAIRLGIFPYDTGHVFQADHMPVGIGQQDLLAYFPLRGIGHGKVDGNVQAAILQGAGGGGKALGEQGCHQHTGV